MGQISLSIPQVGQPDTTEDPKVANDLTIIQNVINGNIDSTNIAAALAQSAGVNATQTTKGAVNISTSQNTSNASFTTLSTPDQVSNVVLATNGLINIWYQAAWSCTVATAPTAAIFLNSNQLTFAPSTGGSPTPQSVSLPTTTAQPLATYTGGLNSGASGTYLNDVTTGQLVGIGAVGGVCSVFAAAGTYTVSVQFKTSSGTVNAANRKLWVQAISFT